MKKLILLVSTFISLSIAQLGLAAEKGDTAPAIALPNQQGEQVSLADHSNKVVLIDFWASWCQACGKSLKWLEGLQNKYGEKGFQVFTVNVDEEKDDATKLLKKNDINLIVGFDPEGKVAQQYDLLAMPSSYLIDRNGKIVSVHEGIKESEKKLIEQNIIIEVSKKQ